MTNDVFEDLDSLPEDNIEVLATRLEERANMAAFAAMRDRYFDEMALRPDARILELGGGTGIVGRAYSARAGFCGRYIVSDLSQNLIARARELAQAEGLDQKMDFCVANAITGEGLGDETCDAVIMHTLLSHVPNPAAVVATAARVVNSGGTIAIFDADYASLLIATADEARDGTMLAAFLENLIGQPKIMRQIPRIANGLGLEPISHSADILAEVGSGEFFSNLAVAMTNILPSLGAVPEEEARIWGADVRQSNEAREAFGMCPYFTYLYRKP